MKGLVPVDPNGGWKGKWWNGRLCQDGPANAGWDGTPLKIVLFSGVPHWGFLENLHDSHRFTEPRHHDGPWKRWNILAMQEHARRCTLPAGR